MIKANHVVINYLPQSPEFDPDMNVIDAVVKAVMDTRKQKGEEPHLLQM